MRYLKIVFISFLSLPMFACVIGDAAFKVRGSIKNESLEPYQSCEALFKYDSRVIDRISFSGVLDSTIVFRPSSADLILVVLSCKGAEGTFEYVVNEIPADFEEYIDIGTIILKSEKSN